MGGINNVGVGLILALAGCSPFADPVRPTMEVMCFEPDPAQVAVNARGVAVTIYGDEVLISGDRSKQPYAIKVKDGAICTVGIEEPHHD